MPHTDFFDQTSCHLEPHTQAKKLLPVISSFYQS